MILHTVLFQPKPEVTGEGRRAFMTALQRASSEIPEVRRARIGRRVEVGAAYQGPNDHPYEYAAVIEFDSVEDLRAYLAHPLHQELGRQFWLACERTTIHDSTAVDVADGRDLESSLADEGASG